MRRMMRLKSELHKKIFKERVVLCLLFLFLLFTSSSVCLGQKKKQAPQIPQIPPFLKEIISCGWEAPTMEEDALYLSGRLLAVYDLSEYLFPKKLLLWEKGPYQPVVLKIRVMDYACKGIRYFLVKKGVKITAPVGAGVEVLINANTCSLRKCLFIRDLSWEE